MENLINFKIDTIAGNVHDIEHVLNRFKELLNIKPFIRFELVLDNNNILPVALIMVGKYTIEILGNAKASRPSGMGHVERIIIRSPYGNAGIYDLDQDLKIEIIEDKLIKKPKIEGLYVESPLFNDDAEKLEKLCKFSLSSDNKDEIILKSGNLSISLIKSNPSLQNLNLEEIFNNDPDQHLTGWHRMSLMCNNLKLATNNLVKGGGKLLVPPYKVLPGMRESMIYFPSGLIVQPMEQKLWKMLPTMMIKGLIAKFSSHRMRFKVQ